MSVLQCSICSLGSKELDSRPTSFLNCVDLSIRWRTSRQDQSSYLHLLKAWMGYWHWGWYLHPEGVYPQYLKSLYILSIIFRSDKVFIAPSGVQKERIEPTHIFVLPFPQPDPSPHADRVFLRRPALNLKESACTPLFWNSFDLRDAGSCIHTHSQHAVMATLLWTGPVFTISHQVSHASSTQITTLIRFCRR